MHTHYRPLRLNVGFLLSQSAGYGRQFDFRESKLSLGSDLQVEEFSGSMQLTRTPQGIVAKGDFFAQNPAECARCLKPFAAPIAIHLEDLFVYPPQNATDPLLAIGEDAHLNLEPLLREYVLINQPTRPLCRPDCKGLCPVCGNDLNESECFHPEEEPAGLVVEGIPTAAEPVKQKQSAASEKSAASKAHAPAKAAGAKSVSSAKEKTAKKKTAIKAPRKKAPGGKKTSAAGKSAGGGKKKPSTKK
ncbi:MAG: DUF177 domain-containing protein [Anaerolineales bacterium]|nr:DUF177 domain-containing protein [Anaerolineales bacterium]